MLELRRDTGLGVEGGETPPRYADLGRLLAAKGVPSPAPRTWQSPGTIRNILRLADARVEEGDVLAVTLKTSNEPPLFRGLADADLVLILRHRAEVGIPLAEGDDLRGTQLGLYKKLSERVRGVRPPRGGRWTPRALWQLVRWADANEVAAKLRERGELEDDLPTPLPAWRQHSDDVLRRVVALRAERWPLEAIGRQLASEGSWPETLHADDRAAEALAEAERVFPDDEMLRQAREVRYGRTMSDLGLQTMRAKNQPAEAVARIRQLAAEGLTGSEMADVLNDEGYRTVTGRTWHPSGVLDVCSTHSIDRPEKLELPLPEEARERLIALYPETASKDELAERLNGEGVATRNGRPWTLSSVTRELDELDDALVRRRNETPPDALERIVDLRLERKSLQEICDALEAEGYHTARGHSRWWPGQVKENLKALARDESRSAEVRAVLAQGQIRSPRGGYGPARTPQHVVTRVLELRGSPEPLSFTAIADLFNGEGVPTPAGAPQWSASTIHGIYRRETARLSLAAS